MKPNKVKKAEKGRMFSDFLIPEFLVACNEVVLGQDNSLTIVKVIDQLTAYLMPLQVFRFAIVSQFIRKTEVEVADFVKAEPYYRLILVKPSGIEAVITEGPIHLSPESPFFTTRLMTDMSGIIAFDELGLHVLKILGRTKESDFEHILEKRISIIESPTVAGVYIAKFSSAAKGIPPEMSEGAGMVLLLPNGTIQGADHAYGYAGNFKIDGSRITAQLTARRQTAGAPSVFGDLEKFELILEGTINANMIESVGYRQENPTDKIKITLARQSSMPVANSGPNRHPIPIETGTPFRSKPAP